MALRILTAVRAQNPQAHVRFADTICQPTRERQQAVDRLLDKVDAMVVVGGKNSNNTRSSSSGVGQPRCLSGTCKALRI